MALLATLQKPLLVSRPRLLRFVGMALVVVLLFWLLPRSAAQVVFVVLIVALIVYALQSAHVRSQLRHLPQETTQSITNAPGQIGSSVMTNVRGVWKSWRDWLIRDDTRIDFAHSLLLLAIVLAVMSALSLRLAVPVDRLWIGALLMVAAIAVLGVGLRLSRELVIFPFPTALAVRPQHARIMLVGLGAALLLAVAEINGNALQSSDVRGISIHAQFALLVGGCIALVWGFGGISLPHLPMPINNTNINWRGVLIVLGLTGLALFLRMWHLDTAIRYPIHEHFYAYFINMMTDADFKLSLFIPVLPSTPAPQVYTYIQWLILELFGNTWFGFRATSAIFGTLMIPTLYLLVNSLFNRRLAIGAALLLATFPQHIHLSRLALANTAEPLFGLLALAFLARALRTNHRTDFAIAGVSLGMTQYFVDEGRVFFPALVVLWLVIGVLVWRPRPAWRGLLTMVLAAILVGLPYYYTMSAQGLPFFPRGNEVGMSYWVARFPQVPLDQFINEVLYNVSGSLLHIVHSPDQQMAWLFYGGQQPLILSWLVPLFLIGMGYALWRSRWPGGLLVTLWIISAAVGIGLVQYPGSSIRFTVLTPAIALAMALGIFCVLDLLHSKSRPGQKYTSVIIGAFIGVISLGQVLYYFGDHLPLYQRQVHQSGFTSCGGATDAVLRSTNFPPQTHIFLISNGWQCDHSVDGNILQMLRGDLTLITPLRSEVTDAYLDRNVLRYVDNAFFVWPEDEAMVSMLHSRYAVDEPQYTQYPDAEPGINFVLYYIPAETQVGPMRRVEP